MKDEDFNTRYSVTDHVPHFFFIKLPNTVDMLKPNEQIILFLVFKTTKN